jgi:hypothetical protein
MIEDAIYEPVLRELITAYKQACNHNDRASMTQLRVELREHKISELMKYRERRADLKHQIQDKKLELEVLSEELSVLRAEKGAILAHYQTLISTADNELEQLTSSTIAARNKRATLYERKLQCLALQNIQAMRLHKEEVELCHRHTEIRKEVNQLSRNDNRVRVKVTNCNDFFHQVKYKLKIIKAEKQLRDFYKRGLTASVEDNVMVIATLKNLAELHQKLADEISPVNQQGKLDEARARYCSYNYLAQAYTHTETTPLDHYYDLISAFREVLQKFSQSNAIKMQISVRQTIIELYGHMFTLVPIRDNQASHEAQAKLYFERATFFYQEALRVKHLSPNALNQAKELFACYQEDLERLERRFPQFYRTHTSECQFRTREEFFQFSEEGTLNRLQQSFNYWFNPARFLKSLIDFNRECNLQALNRKIDKMSEVTYHALRGAFRRQSTGTLIKLDNNIRQTQTFTTFVNLLAWLASNAEAARISFNQSQVSNILGKEANAYQPEQVEQAVIQYLAGLFAKLYNLTSTFLTALKQELDSREQFRNDHDVKNPNDFARGETVRSNFYQRYCLHSISTGFASNQHRLLAKKSKPAEIPLDAPVSETVEVPVSR